MVDITPIRVGDRPNDGKGDLAREAWIKANANTFALKTAVEDISGAVGDLADIVPKGLAALALTARGPLPGGRFLAAYGDRQAVVVAPADSASAAGRAIGYLEGAAADGAAISARVAGAVAAPLADWTAAGLPVYLTDDGRPTTVRRTSGWVQSVGTTTGPGTFALALAPAVWRVPAVALADLVAALPQALTEAVRALGLAPPVGAGVLWRNGSFVVLSPALDGAPYVAPSGAGSAGALDPVSALLPVALPLVLRALPTSPPAGAGVLWRNNGLVALSPALDGSPYPVTLMPSGGAGALGAVRAVVLPWLAGTLPTLPLNPPIAPGIVWRAQHRLALSL
ncbi:hypothetical protein [Methylobacterium frigidaeris]|uniref:Uncharacterized protein n=1 Tax=Methylobacterium frigidaeris TaxID=2038277 RepID=A0AA37M7W0_9HYPH|nr:hypothetical protein [Methylobacterium frigidaeris]PIK74806.1 hypothetical protein CS379_00470 [Methylobacterium frigidaeris]GJD65186.1 hypothetical protein MPEAHAMD_5373 [Methylobacterium frigidaeris]